MTRKWSRGSRLGWRSCLLVSGVASLVALSVLAVESLDGRSFVGETGEVGQETGDAETFVFADGHFDPLQCHPWGFAATPYTVSQNNDGGVRFRAEHRNADGDRMLWEGVVVGDAIEGTMRYWQGEDPPRDYWFRGTAAEAQAP